MRRMRHSGISRGLNVRSTFPAAPAAPQSSLSFLIIMLCIQLELVVSTHSSSCGVWLAPSTITGAGLGLFAGVSYDSGSRVLEGDLIVPIFDIDWHNDNEEWNFLWDDYTWSSSTFEEMNNGEVTEDGSVSGGEFMLSVAGRMLHDCVDSVAR